MMKNRPIVKEIGLEDVYQYEIYFYVLSCFKGLYCIMHNKPIIKEIGLEDVYQYEMYFLSFDLLWMTLLHECRISQL